MALSVEPVYRLPIGHFRCLARASGVATTHLNHQRRRLASLWRTSQSRMGVVRMNANQQKRVKSLSAILGASAVVAMGALGVIFGDVSSAEPAQVVGAVAPQASEQTVTTTTPPPVPATGVATPSVTATTPSGFMPVTKP